MIINNNEECRAEGFFVAKMRRATSSEKIETGQMGLRGRKQKV